MVSINNKVSAYIIILYVRVTQYVKTYLALNTR